MQIMTGEITHTQPFEQMKLTKYMNADKYIILYVYRPTDQNMRHWGSPLANGNPMRPECWKKQKGNVRRLQ